MRAPRQGLARGLLLVGLLCGCANGNDALAELALRGALVAGATAVKYSADCPVDCPTGMPCNKDTGFCERVPCDNRCRLDEQCVRDERGERCERLPRADGGTAPSSAAGPRAVSPSLDSWQHSNSGIPVSEVYRTRARTGRGSGTPEAGPRQEMEAR